MGTNGARPSLQNERNGKIRRAQGGKKKPKRKENIQLKQQVSYL